MREFIITSFCSMFTAIVSASKKFAKYLGVKYALMVNSGSSANLLALSILTNPFLGNKRIKNNEEIITPAVTWPTTVHPISTVGAIPKFVDVMLDDFTINIDEIENTKNIERVLCQN